MPFSRIRTSNLLAFTCLLITTMSSTAQQTQSDVQRISRDQAIAAYASFERDPIANLQSAPKFMQFIETDGEVHIVLDPTLLSWMYEDYLPEVKAVLYAAYMGGNMQSQLNGATQGDDPVGGMAGVLEAYQRLKNRHENLEIPMLERLLQHQAKGALADAVNALRETE